MSLVILFTVRPADQVRPVIAEGFLAYYCAIFHRALTILVPYSLLRHP